MNTKIEVRGTATWYQLPGRDWLCESEHKDEAAAARRADELRKIVSHAGDIVGLRRKNGTYIVFHTAMFRRGFGARNAHAKGFLSAFEVFRRPANDANALCFLGGSRARWATYDSKKALLDDERVFAPEYVEEISKKL